MEKQTRKTVNRTDINGKIPPSSVDAEKAALGCALVNDNAAIHILDQLTEDSFYLESSKIIFSAMSKIKSKRIRIDIVTLTDMLESEGTLTAAGGVQYLTELSSYAPNVANYASYSDIIKNKYILRRLVESCSQTIEQAYSNAESGEVLNQAELDLYNIAKSQEKGKLVKIENILPPVIVRLNNLKDPKYRLGIPTGFIGINSITNGLQPSDLILIAARPSVGKTAFGMNIISNIALSHQTGGKRYSCAVFSLEMTREQLTQRLLCSVAGVSMSKASKGMLSNADFKQITVARKKLADSDIYIDDTSLIKPMQIMEKCIRLKNERGLDVVMIDYLQLLTSDSRRNENRQTEISEITRYLKIMAKELNVPILLLSQLSRKVEERTDKTPMLSDLRESGAIEQDADIVMFIHRSLNTDNSAINNRENVEIVFAKHRNGELGRVPLRWEGECVRFQDDLTDPNTATAMRLQQTDPRATRNKHELSGGDEDYGEVFSGSQATDDSAFEPEESHSSSAHAAETEAAASESGAEENINTDSLNDMGI